MTRKDRYIRFFEVQNLSDILNVTNHNNAVFEKKIKMTADIAGASIFATVCLCAMLYATSREISRLEKRVYELETKEGEK